MQPWMLAVSAVAIVAPIAWAIGDGRLFQTLSLDPEIRLCKKIVVEGAVSPSSVAFRDSEATENSAGVKMVRLDFEAANRLGGSSRSVVTCNFLMRPTGEMLHIISVAADGKRVYPE